MTPEKTAILTRCFELTKALETSEPHPWEVWEHREWELESENGPRYLIGRWFGPLDERRRMRYRRAVDSLERDGLVKTHREWGVRLTHLALTEAGEAIARELLEEKPVDA